MYLKLELHSLVRVGSICMITYIGTFLLTYVGTCIDLCTHIHACVHRYIWTFLRTD